jgi:glutamate---cysteine ligase / carboxylate-amine ligase
LYPLRLESSIAIAATREAAMREPLTLGVEEEFFAVDPETGAVLEDGRHVLRSPRVVDSALGGERYSDELRMCTLESKTGICRELGEVRAELQELRDVLAAAARDEGIQIASAGTFPVADWRTLGFTPKPRNEEVAARFARMAREHVICACHVHVGVEGREAAIGVVNRVRPWLPALLALSASSPFWIGEDTGFASYRSIMWERWPMAGMPPDFRSYAHYQQVNELLIDAQISFDAAQVHWDIRPGTQVETVEFRIADACTTVDDAVVQAALSRALVRTSLDDLARGEAGADATPLLLRVAKWRAARFGLSGLLLDPRTGSLVPAPALVQTLLEHVRPALEETGDWGHVTALLAATGDATAADRQRAAFARRNEIADVAAHIVAATAGR